jgi:GTP 3',8-cyclase
MTHEPIDTEKPVIYRDRFGRPLQDLRISVTDKCNFRCVYCMPKEIFGADHVFMHGDQLLSFEELQRLVRIFAAHGVRKVRLTGGEPLLRRNIDKLVEMVAEVPGIDDLAMSTNGSVLTKKTAIKLKEAGLQRISISLDSLNEEVFKSLNDVNFPVSKVLEAIDNAAEAGLTPIKVNMVVKRGHNEDSILPMAEHFRGTGHILRFIEFMDVGNHNKWRLDDVIPGAQIVHTINEQWPIEPVDPNYRGEVARRYRYKDGKGEIGIIASVTQPFCSKCSRARLSSDGKLFTCLFASDSTDIRELLRSGKTDEEITQVIESIWTQRDDRYSELRSQNLNVKRNGKKVEMSYIGG